jgi:hypothetical protein
VHSKDAILPVSYFPSVAYLSVINRYSTTIELHEHYQRRSMRNKTTIISANGTLDLIVPLKKGKTKSKVKDVRIAYDEDWITNHIRSIQTAYGTAPYFDFYYEDVSAILLNKPVLLCELIFDILSFLQRKNIIGIFESSQSYRHSNELEARDFRSFKMIAAQGYAIYQQVFEHKYGFVPNLSILDTLFNTGPESRLIIDQTVL